MNKGVHGPGMGSVKVNLSEVQEGTRHFHAGELAIYFFKEINMSQKGLFEFHK